MRPRISEAEVQARYADRMRRIHARLARLQQALEAKAARHVQDSENWGLVGDLAEVIEHLDGALHYAGDTDVNTVRRAEGLDPL
jgi:soluble cytochrome b562